MWNKTAVAIVLMLSLTACSSSTKKVGAANERTIGTANADRSVAQIMEVLAPGMSELTTFAPMVDQALGASYPRAKPEVIVKVREEVFAALLIELKARGRILDRYAQALRTRLTPEELQQAAEFASSSVGQNFYRVMSDVAIKRAPFAAAELEALVLSMEPKIASIARKYGL